MNAKDRFTTALALGRPDHVPVAAAFQAFWALGEFGVTVPESHADPRKAAQAIIDAQRVCPFDQIEIMWDWTMNLDQLGCTSKVPDKGQPMVVKHAVQSPADIDRLRAVDRTTPDQRTEATLVSTEILLKEFSDEYFCTASLCSPLTLASYLRGVSDLMKDLYRDPQFVSDQLDFATEILFEEIDLYASLGVHGMFVSDPSASGSVMSARHFAAWAMPANKRAVERIRAHGVAPFLHVCGDCGKILDYVKEIGPAVFSFDHSTDMALAKEVLGGSVCLMGNLDPSDTLLMGTPEKVREHAQAAVDKGADSGGFTLAAGCDIGVETPLENLLAMIEIGEHAVY